MFLEKDSHNKTQGWIEVICGSMFSGKTEELIRRLKRAKIAKLKVEIFKPGVDTRYSEEDVVSHNSTALHSIPVAHAHPNGHRRRCDQGTRHLCALRWSGTILTPHHCG